jgi:hypothetical protein
MEVDSMTECAQCRRSPTGVEGHSDLFVHTMGAAQMQFKCRSCGAIWARHSPDSGYVWTRRHVAEPGAEVPLQAIREPGRR